MLASASPRRRELLAALVADFEVVASEVPEDFTGEAIDDAMRLAAEKAVAVAESHDGAVILAADT
ncbi:MAG TPA: Maf family protein, partial [Tepidiformaceae bacterium]|nr:Maf family protein [Tepidiformaceae bacterium]